MHKNRDYKFRRGTTAWLKENVRDLIASETIQVTTGAGKAQPGFTDKPVGRGEGPGGEEGMDLDVQV